MCTCEPVPLAGQQECEAFVAAVNSRSIMTGLLKGGNMKKGMFKKKQVLLFTSLFSLLLNSYFFSPQKKRFIFFKFHLTYAICSVVAAVLLQCSRLQEALYFVAKQTQHKGRKVDKICEFQEKRLQTETHVKNGNAIGYSEKLESHGSPQFRIRRILLSVPFLSQVHYLISNVEK